MMIRKCGSSPVGVAFKLETTMNKASTSSAAPLGGTPAKSRGRTWRR
jgi:hypothetical protein